MSSDLDTIPLRPLDLTVGGLTVSLLGARDHDALLAATSNRGHLPFGLVLASALFPRWEHFIKDIYR